jgi:phage terminase small subunit
LLKSLTEKQRLFVRAYLIDGNGKKAAIAAGYSPKGAEVAASRLLSQAKVQEALAAARMELAAISGVTPEWVLAQLQQMATLDIREVVRWESEAVDVAEDPNTGVPILKIDNRVVLTNSDDLSPAAAAAISEVAQTKSGLKVKKHDRLAVLRTIAQILGMFPGQAKAPKPGAKAPAAEATSSLTPDPPQDDAGGWGTLLN